MIIPKSSEEIELLRESALIVSKTLGMLAPEIKPGVTTLHLDKLAEEFIRDHGAVPGFLGLYDFPNSLCMSPNAQVVHGIPNDTPLQEGDIISIDCGALKNGFYGDHAYTFAVGEISQQSKARACRANGRRGRVEEYNPRWRGAMDPGAMRSPGPCEDHRTEQPQS